MMKIYGLIGYPLSHSFSQKYFRQKFINEHISDAEHHVYPLEKIEDFVILCEREKNLAGLNVTIPYKEQVIPYLDELDAEAAKIGAVNTIKFKNGKKTGYNTDIYGFEMSLKPLLKPHHKQALILGTGGASKAVAYVLKKLGITFQYVSRHKTDKSISYNELNALTIDSRNKSGTSYSTLIINTTPVGMFPNADKAPDIPYEFITDKYLLYDLVYNPEETLFLQKGKENGAQTKNGLEMLYLQAEKSWEIWNS